MSKPRENCALINEEQRIVTWFLGLFYLVIVLYDFFYYYIVPKYILDDPVGFPSIYNYLTYVVIIGLLPIAVYLIKSQKYNLVKYIYFISYVLISTIVDMLIFYGSNLEYKSGSIVEIFFVLFSPLFINSRYFWSVSIGFILKYALVGLVIKSSYVLLPIILIILLSLMGSILLSRFQSYVNSIKYTYDKQLKEIVKGIIATLELKDPYTKGHSERVAGYALSLAKQIGDLTEEELKEFNYACLLHDIGKINIPDHILMKPSRLTKEEFDVIKSHPVVGSEAIKNVEGLGKSISVIRSHHERWDGKGYPDRLKGQDIPFLARITAIADAFDAMTSSRSYRAAMSVEDASKVILEGKGTQFDPELVEEFKKVFPSWVLYHKSYPWEKENELKWGRKS
jgi:HD superfamily phosphodiesterase